MAENKNFIININGEGGVNISEEVVGIIAGLGALEVEGVHSLTGNITIENISKAGSAKLAKAVRVYSADDEQLTIRMSINMNYGFEIPTVCEQVQEKIKQAVETMTGLTVATVDIRIATVSVS